MMRKFALAVGVVNAAQVTPVQKVIQMLNGMTEKGKKEKHEEQVQFAAYKQFCDDTAVEKERLIKEADQTIEKLNADIQKYKADAARLGREITEHDAHIATYEGDKKAATSVRDIESTDYIATHQDYSESVDALGRAITVLKQQNFDRKQATSMLAQLDALIPADKKKVVAAFLAQDPELSYEAPEANAYEFQSGGVVDMLQKLLDKFEDERSDLQKAEVNAKHAYGMLMQDLAAQIENNTQARTEKSASKAKKLQAAADAKGDLTDTTATRDDDAKYLSDLKATCQQKASDFENRQQLRADEITALEKAIEILGSGAVSGAADKHLPALAQVKASLMQLKSAVKLGNKNERVTEVTAYLQHQAERLNSRILAQIAAQSQQPGSDPFAKVKKLIQDLIVRLMEEANEEAEHKGWCDTELAANEATHKEKTQKVETLHAEIDALDASIAKLTEDLGDLHQAVADLDAAVAEATKIRGEEKAKNAATIKDSQEAQTAVAQALEVLKEFYAKAGEATSLLQQPEIFDEAYTGMQSENGGVVGMIEVIQSDFARLEAETSASEAQAEKEYDTFMSDSAVDKAQKSKDIEHKTMKKQNEEQELQEKKGDLEGTQKELDAALAYFDKLKPSCIDSGVSYEDRVARRQEEIESLQEALRILNGEDIA
jgi:predicted TIM-barrel fold metal-dependent hydrolase